MKNKILLLIEFCIKYCKFTINILIFNNYYIYNYKLLVLLLLICSNTLLFIFK